MADTHLRGVIVMRRLFGIMILFSVLMIAGCGETRRESVSEMQTRAGLVYVVNEQMPYTGVIFSLYANNELNEEKNYKEGKPEGVHKKWYENRQIELEHTYKNNLLNGVCKDWHENGEYVR
jgi:antitoxin component YwqK of YwqJK toxin-antitoxin module